MAYMPKPVLNYATPDLAGRRSACAWVSSRLACLAAMLNGCAVLAVLELGGRAETLLFCFGCAACLCSLGAIGWGAGSLWDHEPRRGLAHFGLWLGLLVLISQAVTFGRLPA